MGTFFVSPTGTGTGTFEDPFGTIQDGIDALGPGDVLLLRAGSYAEDVTVSGLEGTASAPIVLRPYARELVTIDGIEPRDVDGEESRFRVGGNDEWVPAGGPDAHLDEYVSARRFPAGDAAIKHGAFIDRDPYTRLISYSRLKDLRADNQRFGRLALADDLDGPQVVKANGDPAEVVEDLDPPPDPVPFKRPWVYMGPGIFFDAQGHIHIRLSHTTNGVPGLAEYYGGVDPRQIRLALSRSSPAPLVVEDCTFVRFEHLTIRFGGSNTVMISGSSDIMFDHVRILAGSHAIRLGGNVIGAVFRHCEVLGGVPAWMFRSDMKDGYLLLDDGNVVENNLGANTSRALLLGVKDDIGTLIHHCEFVDGHDLALFGQRTRFHHNWINNVNDEAMKVDAGPTTELEAFQNVIMQSLDAISFSGDEPGGARRIYRNLIDLRTPVAGIRPRPEGHIVTKDDTNKDGSVFRFGALYKHNPPDGPLDLFQNTCLVAHQSGLAGIQHYVHSEGGVRRAFNNIYVDIDPSDERPEEYATAFLPTPSFEGPTDGNSFWPIGEDRPLLRHRGYQPGDNKPASYETLNEYKSGDATGNQPSSHFADSQALYPPGFENSSIDVDPQFLSLGADGVPQFDDDLRVTAGGPAAEHGVVLSDVGIVDPLAPPGTPDIGCYEGETATLQVGVDGRRQFPEPS